MVSGIGHEDDVTIADLAADYRAATPTAAMVALLPDREQEQRLLDERGLHWRSRIQQRLLRLHRDWDPEIRKQQLHSLLQRNLERRAVAIAGATTVTGSALTATLAATGLLPTAQSPSVPLRDGSKLKAGDAVDAQLHQGVLSLTVQAWQPETSEVS